MKPYQLSDELEKFLHDMGVVGDAWERLFRWEFSNALETSKSPKWKVWAQATPFLTWLDLCSGDGFRRERTLRTLSAGAPNGFFSAIDPVRITPW